MLKLLRLSSFYYSFSYNNNMYKVSRNQEMHRRFFPHFNVLVTKSTRKIHFHFRVEAKSERVRWKMGKLSCIAHSLSVSLFFISQIALLSVQNSSASSFSYISRSLNFHIIISQKEEEKNSILELSMQF